MDRTDNTSLQESPSPALTAADVSPEFRKECVEFFAEVVQVLGIPKSYGQIYGLLFATPYPLSFTDIAEALDISRGSASQGLQALRSFGAVMYVDSGEGRRELFEPELQLRSLIVGILRKKVNPLIWAGAARAEKLHAYGASSPTDLGKMFCSQRMQKLRQWRSQTRILIPLLTTAFSRKRATIRKAILRNPL